MNDKQNDDDFLNNGNIFSVFRLKSIKCVFIGVILFFLLVLISAVIISNFFILSTLYDKINNQDLNAYIIEPVRMKNENFTEILNIRIRTINEILLESKLINLQISMEFSVKSNTFDNKLK